MADKEATIYQRKISVDAKSNGSANLKPRKRITTGSSKLIKFYRRMAFAQGKFSLISKKFHSHK